MAYRAGASGLFLSGGEALVNLTSARLFSVVIPVAGNSVAFQAAVPCDPALNGAMGFTQAVIFGGAGWELCNAIDVTLGYY